MLERTEDSPRFQQEEQKLDFGVRMVVERILTQKPSQSTDCSSVTPYKRLGKISDILHLNNENNQLERRARPPKDVPLDAQSWT